MSATPAREVSPAPKVGDKAPVTERVAFPQPKPTIIVFLRHCGCPFAEKTFRTFTAFSHKHPEIRCIAVSHSSPQVTEDWVVHVGGSWEVDVLVDEDRSLYATWGLGLTSTWHALGPRALYAAYRLGKDEGIWDRGVGSGSRWQAGGAFAVDAAGLVRWAAVARTADDMPDFEEALRSVRPGFR